MSKKSKRMKARQAAIPAARNAQAVAARPTLTETKAVPGAHKASTADYEAQYTYIVPELVRIGIIAGVFFIIIIVLSLFLK